MGSIHHHLFILQGAVKKGFDDYKYEDSNHVNIAEVCISYKWQYSIRLSFSIFTIGPW